MGTWESLYEVIFQQHFAAASLTYFFPPSRLSEPG